MYIYKNKNWPEFTWDAEELISLLGEVRKLEGKIIGKMESLGFELRKEAVLRTLTLEALKSTEIEGEILNADQVRSSVARRLRMDIFGLVPSDRNVEGMVDMVMDATQHFEKPLTAERLFGWHAALFPGGRSGMYQVKTGSWRDDARGPMQIISGAMGRETVHYQAPQASAIEGEMRVFLDWLNSEEETDSVLKAGIAHFWFVTIHPFEDGNGRIARAITDMLLARADGISQRFYSMSAQIRKERKEYYRALERSQKGTVDITEWLQWFLNCLKNALEAAENMLSKILDKHHFWSKYAGTPLNERQVFMINRFLDDFKGKLTTSKWAKMTKSSSDTALRDIQDLINKNILRKEAAGGRSTNYIMVDF